MFTIRSRYRLPHPLLLSLGAAIGLMAGCASIEGAGTATTAQAWVQPSVPPDPATAPLHWRHVIAGPPLQMLVEQALRSAAEPQAALQRLDDVESSMSREESPIWQSDYLHNLQTLEGRTRQRELQTDASTDAVRSALVTAVADAWLALNETEALIALSDRRIADDEAALAVFNRRHEQGAISRLELRQVEAVLGQSQADVETLLQARQAQATRLIRLTGMPVAAADPVSLAADPPAIALPSWDRIHSDALLGRADIVAAESELAASHADIGMVRALFFPSISLAEESGAPSAELLGFVETGHARQFDEVELALPLFQRGPLRNSTDAAELRDTPQIERYRAVVATAFSEAASALQASQRLRAQRDQRDDTLAGQAERVRLIRLRQEAGRATHLDVLHAQQDLADARERAIQARRAWLSSQLRLHKVLGAGNAAYPVDSEQGLNTHE